METFRLTPKAHLLLAVEALKFAQAQPAISAETRRKVGIALASARRDLARLGRPKPATRKRPPRPRRALSARQSSHFRRA
jgi:hypothetical protein